MKQEYRVSVVMPCFKEADGIVEFLMEVSKSFADYNARILVVDDYSPDSTVDEVQVLAKDLGNITVLSQDRNRGHGPSTLIALRAGLELDPDVIIATDGDGQISGQDLRKLCDAVLFGEFSYAEGVRTSRSDPWFRRAVSAATRTLLWVRTGKIVRDANTPFRAYRPNQLRQILDHLPPEPATPNLLVSALVRHLSWKVREVQVGSLLRRGKSKEGSSWNQKFQFLPSARFVRFCIKAIGEWFTTEMREKK
jgi:glycosyltransferase involved in cell wall biosynthesis